MSWSQEGDFSNSLKSMQLQLTTLLEDVGGKQAAALMDKMAQLNGAEREALLNTFIRVTTKLSESEHRVSSKEDRELKEFEDSLFESVVQALEAHKGVPHNLEDPRVSEESKLSVLNGGRAEVKPVKISTLIDLAKARENRKGWKRV